MQQAIAASAQIIQPFNNAGKDANVAKGLGIAVENADRLPARVVANVPWLHVQYLVFWLGIEWHHNDHFTPGKLGVNTEAFNGKILPDAV